MNKLSIKWYWLLFAIITAVHLLGMVLIDIMDLDATQYAAMSREMLATGNYLQLFERGIAHLDKPPFLFWVTALSFKLFGISNFTYKLPSFLFVLIGLWSTFKLGKLLYNKQTGLLASLILYSCQAYFLFINDVRTDTILTGVVILAVWQLYLFILNRSFLNLIFGAIAVGIAMLEKGPIGLMVPALALGSQIIYFRNWKAVWRWEWFLGLFVILLLLAPMCYGLYKQFGQHGLYFYFWTQSFGRITGQNEWHNNSGMFYFVHTFFWAFLPWMFIAVYGVGMNLIVIIKNTFRSNNKKEVITTAGFVLAFIVVSLSQYKLPHYIFVVFPLVAIITADYLLKIMESKTVKNIFIGLNWLTFVPVTIIIGLLVFGTFTLKNPLLILLGFGLIFCGYYYLILGRSPLQKLFISAVIFIVGINFLLNTFFYPTLLQYQGGSVIGKEIEKRFDKDTPVYSYNIQENSLDFYAGRTIHMLKDNESFPADTIYVFTNSIGFNKLQEQGHKLSIIKELNAYRVTELKIQFLMPSTRPTAVKKNYLLRVIK